VPCDYIRKMQLDSPFSIGLIYYWSIERVSPVLTSLIHIYTYRSRVTLSIKQGGGLVSKKNFTQVANKFIIISSSEFDTGGSRKKGRGGGDLIKFHVA